MKFAAFDLETAKLIPETASDLKQYMPLGISCAALAYGDRAGVTIWQGVPQMDKAACQKIVSELREAVNNGYTLLTWNGCGFDFSVLAQESGLTEKCSDLALGHVDLMLLVTFTKGHFLGLDKALTGAGLGGKVKTLTLSDGTVLTSMSGAMAPHLWARGEYQAVLNYLRADVTQLLGLVRVISTRKQIEWTSNSGRPQSVPVSRFLLAKECFGTPEPDVSWMDNPPPREQFVEWIPGWRQRVFGSPSSARSASSVTDTWQYSQETVASPAHVVPPVTPEQEVVMSPGPMADNAPSEGFVVPLSESQYAVLFYCLDILIDSQDVMLSPDMAADVLDIRYQLSSNLLHEDENKLEWAERLAGDYLPTGICAIRFSDEME